MAAADPFSEGETLDRASDLPLFLQIRQRLLREILDWPTADRRFPPEAQLAERFGVSKMTVRQALQGLVDQGLLARRRGAGTVVTDEAVSVERLTPALDIDAQHRAAGRSVETEVLSVLQRPALPAEAEALALAEGAAIVEIRRLRRIAGAPAALDERALEAGLAARRIACRVKRIHCLNKCRQGPAMRLAPGGAFFLEMTAADLPALLDRMAAYEPHTPIFNMKASDL